MGVSFLILESESDCLSMMLQIRAGMPRSDSDRNEAGMIATANDELVSMSPSAVRVRPPVRIKIIL